MSLIAQKLDDKLQEYITEHCIDRNDSNVCTTVQEVIGGDGSGQFLAAKKSYLSAMIALHPSPSVGLHASLYLAQHKTVYIYICLAASNCKSLPFFLFSNIRKGRLLYICPVGWLVGRLVGRSTSPLILSIYTGIKALY